MVTQILYQEEAREALVQGIKTIEKIVSITLGPLGRNILLDKKFNTPKLLSNGFAIIKEIELQDHLRNTGIKLIYQAAANTHNIVGDGTTTTIIITYAIISQGMKYIIAGNNIIDLKKGIKRTVEFLSHKIIEYSKPIHNSKDLIQIATIAANNDNKIGLTVANIVNKIGYEGVISLEESNNTYTSIEIIENMKLDKGFISPLFVKNSQSMEIIQNNPYILITNKKITLVQEELVPILELVGKTHNPLFIITEDLSPEVLSTLIINHTKNIINVVAIRAPGFGHKRQLYLEDISTLTDCNIIGDATGLRLTSVKLYMLGKARKIIINQESTTIILNNKTKQVSKRCNQLRKQIDTSNTIYEKENLKHRLSKISGKTAVIKIGSATNTELQTKKSRFKNAIQNIKNATEEGIIPGGGSMNIHLAYEISCWARKHLYGDQLLGALIMKEALLVPVKQILQNTTCNKKAMILEELQTNEFIIGYDILSNQFVNMYQKGIIDPAKVMRLTLQNAASIASMLLTTECIVINKIKYNNY